jgi:hypothetical protein
VPTTSHHRLGGSRGSWDASMGSRWLRVLRSPDQAHKKIVIKRNQDDSFHDLEGDHEEEKEWCALESMDLEGSVGSP